MSHCDHCTRRQFMTKTVAAAGAVGLSQLCLPQTIVAAGQAPLSVCVTSRCIFGGVVVTNEDQADLANPNKAKIDYSIIMNEDCAGIDRGIEAVSSGKADIGTVYRDLTEEEKASGLVETKLGRVCYAIIVSKKNPVEKLTFEQTLKIFAGQIKNWKEVGGKDLDILIYRQKCGANYDFFVDQALAKAGIKKDTARLEEATMSVSVTDTQLEKLAVHEMAVTMAPRHFFDDGSKHVQIDGVIPSADAERSGKYPLFASINLVSRKDASATAKQFLSFMSSDDGRKLVEQNLAMDWLDVGF